MKRIPRNRCVNLLFIGYLLVVLLVASGSAMLLPLPSGFTVLEALSIDHYVKQDSSWVSETSQPMGTELEFRVDVSGAGTPLVVTVVLPRYLDYTGWSEPPVDNTSGNDLGGINLYWSKDNFIGSETFRYKAIIRENITVESLATAVTLIPPLSDQDIVLITGENFLPTADVGGPYFGMINEPVQFDASGSHDNDENQQSIVQYDWKFKSTHFWQADLGPTPEYTYSSAGTYTVEVRVTDDEGGQSTDATTVEVSGGNLPPYEPSNPSPPHQSVNVPRNTQLSWTGGDPNSADTVTYDVYFGKAPNPPLVSNNQTQTTYTPGSLLDDFELYQWRIISWDNHGAQTVGPLWEFRTIAEGNSPPVADAGGPYNGKVGQSVTFNASDSTDADGEVEQYRWDFDSDDNWDTTWQLSPTVTHTYSVPNTYLVKVEVQDDKFATDTDTTTAEISSNSQQNGDDPPPVPPPSNNSPTAHAGGPYQGFIDEEILFDGSQSTDDETITQWSWDFGDGYTGIGKTITHSYSRADTYTITLTVTDNDNLTDTNTTSCHIVGANQPPQTPMVQGPHIGTSDTSYSFTVQAIDFDDDLLTFLIDWGDTTNMTINDIPNGTTRTITHGWSTAGLYQLTFICQDTANATSDIIDWPLLIDGAYLLEHGYLLDNDNDSVYDTFYSNISYVETVVTYEDGSYSVDIDGDQIADYILDETGEITSITSEEDENGTPGFELVLFISAFFMFIITRFLRKRRTI